eukprot:TRINITY_DN7379_c0_g1_i5.p2 TRINITY_DN7379_c0_g1~~TRINITY_DN7379_c0_g1_i5.p2  ORF type:complete len:142 (+),score=29.74 TRINITY_DN7379_c0_g1_i5:318-743(+)
MMWGTGAVNRGDTIVCVNGVSNDIKKMKKELRQPKINSVVLKRPVLAAPAPRPFPEPVAESPTKRLPPKLPVLLKAKAMDATPKSMRSLAAFESPKSLLAAALDSPMSPLSEVGPEVLGSLVDAAVDTMKRRLTDSPKVSI